MQRLSHLSIIVLPIVLIAGISFHFLMTIVYLTPLNPVKLRLDPVVHDYMNPFFHQNWQLFAPNPADDTRILMVSCRVKQDNGQITTTDWSDISEPLRSMHHQNRFSPGNRLDRLQTGASRVMFRTDPVYEKLKENQSDQDSQLSELVKRMEEQREKERDTAINVLNRVASAHCDRLHGAGNTTEVRLRLAMLTFPRFSQRNLPDEEGLLEYYMFDWAPYEHVVSMTPTQMSR